jgi:polygalacturonase
MSNHLFRSFLRTPFQLAVIALGVLAATTALGNPTLPTIPPNLFNVTNYGAVGDGVTVSTIAISNAIVAAGAAGGGTVEIPAALGAYLCGPLLFRSGVNLQIDANATLKMLPVASWPGGSSPPDFIVGSTLHDIEISGSGTIDGQSTASGWWNGRATSARPYMISFDKSQRVWIRDVTLKNAPKMHISLKGKGGDITIQNITINTPTSPNTDGIDLVGTNCLVQDCHISDGDDNIALGTSSANTPTSDTTVSGCTFGIGHGVSIGSNTAGGVSNLTVINCTFNNTQYGIRMKSDNATSGSSGAGGTAQNLFYYNLGMTNITYGPIVIYSYYNEYGTPIGLSPSTAAAQSIGSTNIPIWRNIVISNLTATVSSSGMAGIVWGRIESPVSNIFLSHLNITAPRTFDVYNVDGFQCADSQFNITSGAPTFTLFNADVTVSNSAPGAAAITLDGLTSTNSLALYRTPASMIAGDAFGMNPITIAASILADNTSLTVPDGTVFNFTLGTNIAEVTAQGNLTVNDTLNIAAGDGFGAGTYTLFSYAGSFFGTPVLGSTPPGYNYTITNPPGLIQLLVQSSTPPTPPVFGSISAAPGGLVMSGSGGTTNGSFYVLASTNVALPRNQWTPVGTNLFDASGNFIFTNAINPNSPQTFYLLQLP